MSICRLVIAIISSCNILSYIKLIVIRYYYAKSKRATPIRIAFSYMFTNTILKDFYFSTFPARIAAPYAPAYLPSGSGVTVRPSFLERSSAK